VSVRVDRPPEILQFAADPDEHLIEEPFVAWLWTSPFQPIREKPTKAQASLPDTFVTDDHGAGGQDQLDLTQAEPETMIQPDRVLDDLGREAKAAIGIGQGRHAQQAAAVAWVRQPDNVAQAKAEHRYSHTAWLMISAAKRWRW
jgi:hypothetical protein